MKCSISALLNGKIKFQQTFFNILKGLKAKKSVNNTIWYEDTIQKPSAHKYL